MYSCPKIKQIAKIGKAHSHERREHSVGGCSCYAVSDWLVSRKQMCPRWTVSNHQGVDWLATKERENRGGGEQGRGRCGERYNYRLSKDNTSVPKCIEIAADGQGRVHYAQMG